PAAPGPGPGPVGPAGPPSLPRPAGGASAALPPRPRARSSPADRFASRRDREAHNSTERKEQMSDPLDPSGGGGDDSASLPSALNAGGTGSGGRGRVVALGAGTFGIWTMLTVPSGTALQSDQGAVLQAAGGQEYLLS